MSAHSEKPLGTFLWTIAIGYWIAFMYWLLKETRKRSPIAQAVRFDVVIFGGYWLIYNSFVLLFLKLSVLNLFLRVIIDVVSITVGIWVANKLSLKVIARANWTDSEPFSLGGLATSSWSLFLGVILTSSWKSADHIESQSAIFVGGIDSGVHLLVRVTFWTKPRFVSRGGTPFKP